MDEHRTAAAKPSRRESYAEAERRGRARLNAWLLALLVLAFYLGFIGISAIKSFTG